MKTLRMNQLSNMLPRQQVRGTLSLDNISLQITVVTVPRPVEALMHITQSRDFTLTNMFTSHTCPLPMAIQILHVLEQYHLTTGHGQPEVHQMLTSVTAQIRTKAGLQLIMTHMTLSFLPVAEWLLLLTTTE